VTFKGHFNYFERANGQNLTIRYISESHLEVMSVLSCPMFHYSWNTSSEPRRIR